METNSIEKEGFYIIQVKGDVDAASSIQLDSAIEEALNQGKNKIFIDCTHLNYISSAGLGVFVSYIDVFKEKDVYFALYNMNERVKNIFEILGLNKVLSIADSLDEAKP